MKKLNISLDSLEPLIQKAAELTRMQRIIICAATVVVVIGAFVLFLYKPQYEKIGVIKKHIAEQQEKLEKTKASAAEFDTYKKLMEEKQVQFNIAARELPLTAEVPSLLKDISQAGKDSGLTFLLFQPQAEVRHDFYADIPVKMELSGSYHDLGSFFDRLAGMPRIVNINSFDMSGASPVLKISCVAETYKFIEQQPAPATDQKKGKKGGKK